MEKNKFTTRIKKISGQVNGIEKMLTDKRNCTEVVQQIIAARSALSSLALEILKQESCDCDNNPKKAEKLLKNLETIFKIS